MVGRTRQLRIKVLARWLLLLLLLLFIHESTVTAHFFKVPSCQCHVWPLCAVLNYQGKVSISRAQKH
jgi:hypothetical protein